LRERPPRSRKRREGGGRPPALSAATTERLEKAYQTELKRKPQLAKTSLALKFLKRWLPEAERNVSDRTLVRWIIKPVRTK